MPQISDKPQLKSGVCYFEVLSLYLNYFLFDYSYKTQNDAFIVIVTLSSSLAL